MTKSSFCIILLPYTPLFRSDGRDPAGHGRDRGHRAAQGFTRNRVYPGHLHDRLQHCAGARSEEHTSELQSPSNIVCRLLLEKKNTTKFSLMNTTHEVRALYN